MAYLDTTQHIPKFSGNIWYVSQDSGSDSNSGRTPETAFETIGAAISAMADGDAINVKAGTYTETGLDLSKNATELWLELGALIQPASGTALTVSGNYCRIKDDNTGIFITPAANQTGLLVSGNFCYVENTRVSCASSADLGYDITGAGCVLTDCRCADPLVAAFKIQGDKIKLQECCTGGTPADTSIGFWFTNSCDKARVRNCGSQGHGTAGWQVDSGCTNGVIENCYSGGGDGKWTDADNAFVWSNFSYERIKYAYTTFTATGGVGGAGTNYNIFKITGAVKVYNIFGHVTTETPATNSVANLELYSSNASVDITDDNGGPDLVSRVVGTVLERNEPLEEPLAISEPDNTPAVIESSNYRDPKTPIILIKDDAADTYIQLVLTAALASGAIHWHIEWEPVTDDGFVEIA